MGILRFILAITVVIAHSGSIFGFRFVGGQIAVQAFYIISGFYMSLILNEKYVGINGSYKLFISNRLLRLFPIYWTVLFMTIAFSIAISLHTNGNNLGHFTIYAEYFNSMSFGSFFYLLFTNLFIIFQDISMFLGFDRISGHFHFTSDFRKIAPGTYQFMFIQQAWTIAIEIYFYLIAPFIVRKKLNIIFILIITSLLLRFILSYSGYNYDPWSYRFFPTELLFFLLGIISYHIYVRIRVLEIKKYYLNTIFLSITGFTVFFDFLPIPYKYQIYLLLFFICLPFIFILTKQWKHDIYIGELSYPIYISHLLVLTCINTFKKTMNSELGLSLTILTILFSIALNELVAKKIERIRQKRILHASDTLLPKN